MKTKTQLTALLLLAASLACTLTGNLAPAHPPATEAARLEGTATTSTLEVTSTPSEPTLDQDLTSFDQSQGNPDIETSDSRSVCFANSYDGLVRVRDCPGLDCREITILPAGTVLNLVETVTGEAGTWAQIAYPVEGWLNARYICGESE
jgi:ABC-type transport system substrate-binding protein